MVESVINGIKANPLLRCGPLFVQPCKGFQFFRPHNFMGHNKNIVFALRGVMILHMGLEEKL